MNDRFFNHNEGVNRLYKEWQHHPRLIVACDFDDTAFDFKKQGDEYPQLFELLNRCQKHNFYIVMWTASKPERYTMINEYMISKGIVISSINENPVILPYGNNKKIYYNILLDDRAGLESSYKILTEVIDKIEKN